MSPERYLIENYINTYNPVIDLGAGIGYTSCLLSEKTSNGTKVVAVEGNKDLYSIINKNKK